MSKRVPKESKNTFGERTQFQLHKSQQTVFLNFLHLTYDFSEYKLTKLIENEEDPQKKMLLTALLHDYVSGHVAIAWNKGEPSYIRITKE